MSSERQLDNVNDPWSGEHFHRYEEASKLIPYNPSKILDIACGSGFGSQYLAKFGHQVIGGDLSKDTILDCKNKYNLANLSFQEIDGTKIPYENHFFDIVISFETIEHTTQYKKMLEEFKRVVKDDGTIILSTPNFLINSPGGVIINKYHTQEWIYEDFLKILRDSFSNVTLLGQEYVRYKSHTELKYKIANIVENIFYIRGIRKLSISIQDAIMNMIIQEPMYPLSSNYRFTKDVDEIKRCKTFFAICNP
ncbi:MAG: class I SAM-dependent methyltransferase [Bacteroidota bacterium]